MRGRPSCASMPRRTDSRELQRVAHEYDAPVGGGQRDLPSSASLGVDTISRFIDHDRRTRHQSPSSGGAPLGRRNARRGACRACLTRMPAPGARTQAAVADGATPIRPPASVTLLRPERPASTVVVLPVPAGPTISTSRCRRRRRLRRPPVQGRLNAGSPSTVPGVEASTTRRSAQADSASSWSRISSVVHRRSRHDSLHGGRRAAPARRQEPGQRDRPTGEPWRHRRSRVWRRALPRQRRPLWGFDERSHRAAQPAATTTAAPSTRRSHPPRIGSNRCRPLRRPPAGALLQAAGRCRHPDQRRPSAIVRGAGPRGRGPWRDGFRPPPRVGAANVPAATGHGRRPRRIGPTSPPTAPGIGATGSRSPPAALRGRSPVGDPVHRRRPHDPEPIGELRPQTDVIERVERALLTLDQPTVERQPPTLLA